MSRVINGRRRGTAVWWGALVGLGVLTVAALVYNFGAVSSALVHLLYVPVLAGAFLFGTRGGVLVGVASGAAAGAASATSPYTTVFPVVEWMIGTASLVAVGFFTGRILTTLREREAALTNMVDETVAAFVQSLHAIDGSTADHSQQVAEYAVAIARELKLEPDRVEQVRRAALLHDVGKLVIPKEILNKPGPLNPDEWEVIRRHPEESERIVGRIESLQSLLPAVRHHHERVDGRGYPDGIKGAAVPLEARIITVADAFDAMTSRRAYRAPLSEEEAVEQLLQNAGSQFDPLVVDAFLRARNISYSVDEIASSMRSL